VNSVPSSTIKKLKDGVEYPFPLGESSNFTKEEVKEKFVKYIKSLSDIDIGKVLKKNIPDYRVAKWLLVCKKGTNTESIIRVFFLRFAHLGKYFFLQIPKSRIDKKGIAQTLKIFPALKSYVYPLTVTFSSNNAKKIEYTFFNEIKENMEYRIEGVGSENDLVEILKTLKEGVMRYKCLSEGPLKEGVFLLSCFTKNNKHIYFYKRPDTLFYLTQVSGNDKFFRGKEADYLNKKILSLLSFGGESHSVRFRLNAMGYFIIGLISLAGVLALYSYLRQMPITVPSIATWKKDKL